MFLPPIYRFVVIVSSWIYTSWLRSTTEPLPEYAIEELQLALGRYTGFAP
jgi:hypothetical protein